jgi:hypothetical protein
MRYNMIWFIVLTTIMSNGDVYAEVQFPLDPQYNNEQSCNESGIAVVNQKQLELGTNSGKVLYTCQSTSSDTVLKALGKSGSPT